MNKEAIAVASDSAATLSPDGLTDEEKTIVESAMKWLNYIFLIFQSRNKVIY